MLSYFLAIASKHHCFLDTYCFQLLNSCFTIRLNLVINDDMTSVLSVDGHVNDRTNVMAIVPFGTYCIHHANQRLHVSIPIVDAMYAILYEHKSPTLVIQELTTHLQ